MNRYGVLLVSPFLSYAGISTKYVLFNAKTKKLSAQYGDLMILISMPYLSTEKISTELPS